MFSERVAILVLAGPADLVDLVDLVEVTVAVVERREPRDQRVQREVLRETMEKLKLSHES